MGGGPRLGHVEPRERSGAQTGRKYEYQYERTARAALDLLSEGSKYVCVYCDWHDDYVIETGDPPTKYVFHQVKGRKSSQGPWTFREFFGVLLKKSPTKSKKPPEVKDGIVPFMLLHHVNFGDACAGVVFVTNAGLEPALSAFLNSLSQAGSVAELPEANRIAFQHVARAYIAANPKISLSEAALLGWLQGLKVHTDQGLLEDAEAALLELANVVVEFSEIELLQRHAKQIAREIVSRIRSKVAHCTTIVPASDEQLRDDKGIVISELLSLLSLSAPAYEQLKAGTGKNAVKTLSRLQRFCKKQGMQDWLLEICEFKAQWDIWRTI